eukprot:1176380-Pyramimonas_sp.AAC.1
MHRRRRHCIADASAMHRGYGTALPQTWDVLIVSLRGPRKSPPFPRDRLLILSRLLTVPGLGEGPQRPKIGEIAANSL